MDISFKTTEGRFNFRAGAIILQGGMVLLVKNERSSYYYSVGGRVKMNETCEQAVLREVREELGISMEIDRMAFFHENLFNDCDTKERFHEIAVFFLMKPSEALDRIVCRSVTEEDGAKEHTEWLPINRLSEYRVFPAFFAKELQALVSDVRHIVES